MRNKKEKKLLSNSCESIRIHPQNLVEEDKAIFAHEFRKGIQAVMQMALDNIYFTGKGIVVAKKGTDYPEAFSKPTTILYLPGLRFYYNILKTVIKNRLKIIRYPVVFVVESSISGYFHWVTEVLPRLVAGGEELRSYPVIIPEKYDQFPFIWQSLKMLGFNILYVQKQNNYLLKEVYFITHFATAGNYNDYFIQKTKVVLNKDLRFSQPRKLVYISRQKAERRKIANEGDVCDVLSKLHFKTVYCEDLSLQEQAVLFSQTRVVVANHGAGLTNMIFMPKGAAVLELRYKNDMHNNCYFTLASALDIAYYYQQCVPVHAREDPHFANIIVDKEILLKTLLSVLRQTV